MHFRYILWIISLIDLLHDIRAISSCTADHCADKPEFTSSRVVVKFGDGFNASCSVCQHACLNRTSGLEISRGDQIKNGTTVIWTVVSMNIWDTFAMCHYRPVNSTQCCSILPVTVYQPPDDVSFSFVNHTGPMLEGKQYTLQCLVRNVAPVGNLTVTFYGGQTKLGSPQSRSSSEKKPVTEIFTLDITPSKDDDGVQYWCEARLDLGPEGPEPPPVVESQNINSTVYFKPQLKESPRLDSITITEGNPVQLNCSAVGNPTPSYTWKRPMGRTPSSDGNILLINSVTSADEGLYTCVARNYMGIVTVNFIIIVQHKPRLNGPSDPELINLAEGDTLQLNCSAWGKPSPSYTWKHSGNAPLSSSDSILTISHVTTEHKGLYICTASNAAGSATARFEVEVKGKFPWYIIIVVIVALVLIFLAVIVYSKYYKHNKMGRYNLKDVFHLHSKRSAVPTVEL